MGIGFQVFLAVTGAYVDLDTLCTNVDVITCLNLT